MIGKILRTMRRQAKMSQEDLEKIIGFSNTTLSQYETGNRQPSFETIENIAKACGFKIIFINEEKNLTYTTENINREEI